MTITARMLTQDKDGIGGYMAHPDGAGARPGIMMVHHAHGVTADYKIDAYRLAELGFDVLVPSFFNMFGIPGTNHIGMGAELQSKHSDGEFLEALSDAEFVLGSAVPHNHDLVHGAAMIRLPLFDRRAPIGAHVLRPGPRPARHHVVRDTQS